MFARLWSLQRLLRVWKVSNTKPDQAKDNPPDCIIMLAFGQEIMHNQPDDVILPGPVNETLAKEMSLSLRSWTTYLTSKLPPVLAQWEFAETNEFKSAARSPQLHLVHTFGSSGTYRNTREILEEVKKYMDKRGWKRAIMVAHPRHLVRCIWTAENLGIEVVNNQYLVQDLNYYADVWNKGVEVPPKQGQTTSLAKWCVYELVARLVFWKRGWI